RAIHAHFIAYCGRYEVYEQAGLVIHRLEMHVTPNFVGNVLVRRASLEGPRLTLRPLEEELPAGMLEYTLRWRRAERASGELDHTG
ncbi:MAG: lipocalin-like domain-containing protein, partial [Usitatibacter sp.]